MFARVVFSVFKCSVTLVLVFHFVSKPLSVPSGYYLSLQLVNKQPGLFAVPLLLPLLSVQ